jgi:hypothetical protein
VAGASWVVGGWPSGGYCRVFLTGVLGGGVGLGALAADSLADRDNATPVNIFSRPLLHCVRYTNLLQQWSPFEGDRCCVCVNPDRNRRVEMRQRTPARRSVRLTRQRVGGRPPPLSLCVRISNASRQQVAPQPEVVARYVAGAGPRSRRGSRRGHAGCGLASPASVRRRQANPDSASSTTLLPR